MATIVGTGGPSPLARVAPIATSRRAAFTAVWHDPPGLLGVIRQVQNIPIAHRYMTTAFLFFLLGGVQALLLRVQLATAEGTFLDARRYNELFTMHGTTMMFLFVIPFIEAVATYVLPLMLGTREMPFPRMTALSYWTYLFGGLFLYASFFVGAVPDGGWFAYAPLSNAEYSPGLGGDFWDIGLSVAEVAAIGAAAELSIGILRMRAPGMALSRMPVFAWSMLITAVMLVFAFTPLIVGTAMLELDRKGLTRFFDPEFGGKPLLWQHIFWVFGHPEVYIMLLPAVGMVSHVVQTFARRPIVAYPAVVVSMLAIGFLSFGLWVHHMFATGLSPVGMGFFMAASLMVAIPSGVLTFCWIATLGLGRPVWRTPLLFALGFVAVFVVGGVTGVMLAVVPFNWQAHDTHFVVGHFHYTLIGGAVFPFFAGLYYWLPKMTGRRLSERLGRWNFWAMFVFFNVTFLPMHLAGILGMPRRVFTYPGGLGLEPVNLVTTVGAFGFAAGVLLFVVNLAWSLRHGAPAGSDPWAADTLEWAESSPPPEAQFARLPVVDSRHPLWSRGRSAEGAALERYTEALDEAPTRWRGGIAVSVADGRPVALLHFPGPSIAPFATAIGFVFVFCAALVDSVGLFVVGAGITGAALAIWFWPQNSERAAIEETAAGAIPIPLPLGVAGPAANGWWGAVVLVVTLGIALATILASYVYLLDGRLGSVRPGGFTGSLLGAIAALAAGVAAWWAARGDSVTQRRAGLATASMLFVGSVALSVAGFAASGVTPRSDAYGSAVLALDGFQWCVSAVLLVMLGVAQAWAWWAPRDVRGLAVALNADVVARFVAASGIIVFATVHLTPWLGG